MDKHLEVYERAVNTLKCLVNAYEAEIYIKLSEIPIPMSYFQEGNPIRTRTYYKEFL